MISNFSSNRILSKVTQHQKKSKINAFLPLTFTEFVIQMENVFNYVLKDWTEVNFY